MKSTASEPGLRAFYVMRRQSCQSFVVLQITSMKNVRHANIIESHTFFIYRPLTTARDKKNVTKDTCVSMFKKQFSIHTGLWSRISGQKHSRNGPELVWINDYVLFFWCTALISDMRFLPVEQACFPCGRITNIPSAKKARQNRWNTASSLVLGKAIICFL